MNGDTRMSRERRRQSLGGRGRDGDRLHIEAAVVQEPLDRQPPFRDEQPLPLQGGRIADVTIGSESSCRGE
jgi:hypothetical protein